MEDRIKDFFERDFDPGQTRTGQAATEETIATALKYIASLLSNCLIGGRIPVSKIPISLNLEVDQAQKSSVIL